MSEPAQENDGVEAAVNRIIAQEKGLSLREISPEEQSRFLGS